MRQTLLVLWQERYKAHSLKTSDCSDAAFWTILCVWIDSVNAFFREVKIAYSRKILKVY